MTRIMGAAKLLFLALLAAGCASDPVYRQIAEPATQISTPAATTCRMLDASTPPSMEILTCKDRSSIHRRSRRVVGPEQREARNPQLSQLVIHDPRSERVQVGLDLGELRHEESPVASRQSPAKHAPRVVVARDS